MSLTDKALIWWDSFDNCDNVDKNVWTYVQREFIEAYAPRFTARTTYTNFLPRSIATAR
jgi:DNA polymerase IIIc chi subunit